jgi:hypothetical protein
MDHEQANMTRREAVVINCSNVNAPTALSFLTFSLSLVFFLVVVSGNVLVILAILKDPFHELRNKPFIFLVGNLACADLIVGIVVTPISVVLHFMEGQGDSINTSWVKVLHMSYFISCTASLLSMAAITIDRHIAIAYPLHYRSISNSRKPLRISAAIWVIAVSLPFVYFKVGYIKYAFVFGNIAICVTVFFLSSCMYIIRKMSGGNSSSPSTNVTASQRSQRHARAEKQITKVFSLVLVAYLLCYAPSCSIIYVMNFCVSCSCEAIHWLRDMQFVLVLLNSCLNPILYSWQMKAFRNAFKLLVCSSFKRLNMNSTVSVSRQLPSSFSNEPSTSKRDNFKLANIQGESYQNDGNSIELTELPVNSLPNTVPTPKIQPTD